MKPILKYILIITLICAAFLLFFVNSDREFIRYLPQEGEPFSIVLRSDSIYQQTFASSRHTISRLSLFIRPSVSSPLPAKSFIVSVHQADHLLAQQAVATSFIDDGGATQVQFTPPITTEPGQILSFSISVPPALSGKIRAQTVNQDDKPVTDDISLTIDSSPQPQPLAFQLYYGFRPPLSFQLSILLLLAATLLLLNRPLNSPIPLAIYIIATAAAYISPSIIVGDFSFTLLLAFFLAQLTMILLLYSYQLPAPVIFLGANAFAFSTYFPLHVYAERDKLIIFALLPALFWLTKSKKSRHIFLTALLVLSLSLLIFLPYASSEHKPVHVANLKDILLDPNQIPTTDKFHAAYYALQIPKGDPNVIDQYGGWDHFGSYFGLINLSLALLGIVIHGKKHWPILLLGALAIIVSANSFITPHLATIFFFPPQHLIIISSFALAVFAALGLNSLWRFLKYNPLTNTIIYLIVFIALLDLLNVSSKTLQFGLL